MRARAGSFGLSSADGFLAEHGPNSILETSPRISGLVAELGLEDEKIYSEPAASKRYLVRNGALLEAPSSAPNFLASKLFSSAAKLRLLAEPFIRRAPGIYEESLAEFVVRRLGREFLDYAINPFVAGVYAGDPARLSVRHAFPKLHALEQRYGSLLIGQVLGARERKARREISKQQAPKFSFRNGLQTLTNALARRLENSLKCGVRVQRLERSGEGWHVALDQSCHSHRAVLVAAPAYRVAHLPVRTPAGLDLSPLGDVRYAPVATLVLGFRTQDVAHPLDGFGVLIPECERFNILGAIFSSSLFPNRAPAGHVTITCYLGGMRSPALAQAETSTQLELAMADLRKLLGVRGHPLFVEAARFRQGIPQYEVGFGRIENFIRAAEEQADGLFLAGNYRGGISLGDSILNGEKAAERIAQYLSQPAPARKGHE